MTFDDIIRNSRKTKKTKRGSMNKCVDQIEDGEN